MLDFRCLQYIVGFLIGPGLSGTNTRSEWENIVAKRTGKASRTKSAKLEDQSLAKVFWTGFFWPIRGIGRGIAWLSHRPPLKQIGHALRWFFRLRAVRFVGRLLGFRYFRDSWRELKLVTWPTIPDSLRLTLAVILFSVVFGTLIAIVDYGLDKIFRQILLK